MSLDLCLASRSPEIPGDPCGLEAPLSDAFPRATAPQVGSECAHQPSGHGGSSKDASVSPGQGGGAESDCDMRVHRVFPELRKLHAPQKAP
jgi:hypothetical protein